MKEKGDINYLDYPVPASFLTFANRKQERRVKLVSMIQHFLSGDHRNVDSYNSPNSPYEYDRDFSAIQFALVHK